MRYDRVMNYIIRRTNNVVLLIMLVIFCAPVLGHAASNGDTETLSAQIEAAQTQLHDYYQQHAPWILQGHSLDDIDNTEIRIREHSSRAEIRLVTDEGERHYLNLIAPGETNDRTMTGMWSTLFTLLMLHYDYAAITTDQAIRFLDTITWQE